MRWDLLNGGWNFWPDGLAPNEISQVCAELGFDGVEVGVYESDAVSTQRLRELQERDEASGIPTSALLFSLPPSRWPHGAYSSGEHAPRAVAEAIQIGRAAAALGLGFVGIWPGGDVLDRSTDHPRAWERLVESLRDVADALRPDGVRAAVEYKPFELVGSADAALRLCDAVGPNLGVVLDTGHALWAGEDLPIVARMLADRLVHVHLGDTPGGSDSDLPPGRHHNFTPFFSALADIGYEGALSLDMYEAVASGTVSGAEASREARDYVRSAVAAAEVAA